MIQFKLNLIASCCVLAACASAPPPLSGQDRAPSSSADLYVVDCLLPGQLRQVGGRTYLTPRRPTRTTASDCRKKGGEYLIYDRSNFESSLAYWMPRAGDGDPEAQNFVGEFYEQGISGTPDFASAVVWYRKAAEQGDARAQFNLARLYEKGNGVEKDTLQALNWYRRAWGMAEDSLIYRSAMDRQLADQRSRLEQEMREKDIQVQLLQQQAQSLQEKLESSLNVTEQQTAMLAQAEKMLAAAKDELAVSQQKIAALPQVPAETTETDIAQPEDSPRLRTSAGSNAVQAIAKGNSVAMDHKEFGKYYALLIGNEHYEQIDDLETPIDDVRAIRDVLEQSYGFSVRVVEDGGDGDVLAALNDMHEVLEEQDNLLIYYAGHGVRRPSGQVERGYWMPRNAEAPPRDTYWVPNEQIVGHLELLRARRVLVVADSCFAELLSEDDRYLFWGSELPDYSDEILLQATLPQRARLLLSSGDDRPVMDGGGSGHSVFARAFIEALQANDGLLAAPALYAQVEQRVSELSRASGFEQNPQYKTITSADHRMGDFFFVPVEKNSIQ